MQVLPVTGVTITTAVQGRSKKITQQVLLNIIIDTEPMEGIFLVVPHLATPMILGDDWLTRTNVILDYQNHVIVFPLWKKSISFQPPSNDLGQGKCSLISVTQRPQNVSRSTLEQNLSNIFDTDAYISPSQWFDRQEVISTMNWDTANQDLVTDIRERIRSIESISSEEREQLLELLMDYRHLFSDRPGLNNLYTCRFNVSQDEPFKVKPYPVPFAKRPAVEHELARMLDWGVVERCSSPYNNPIICVNKVNGSVRLCLDARRVNQIIQPMRDTSPPMEELLAEFGGKRYFTSLDFSAGYWQIPLHPDVRKYTAFVYNGRTYQFCVVPFGLNISNTAFGQGLETILLQKIPEEDDEESGLHIYVDDMMVSSTTFGGHIKRLRHIFCKISKSGMTLKLSKCEFIRQSIKFLGHIITSGGMTLNPNKLKAIHEFPSPRNKKELQSFIGFCNFYRKFSRHHASLVQPLIRLTQKNIPWSFGEEQLRQFNKIKQSFTERFLAHPDFNRDFYIQTDASKLGLGAELFQVDEHDERQTIAFASRTLNMAEQNYSITEMELLSIVYACSKFRIFILGHRIHVITDHQALTFLNRCRLRNARLTRWTLQLQEYDLHITHCTGSSNIMDVLSRNPVGRDNQQPNPINETYIYGINTKLVNKDISKQQQCFSRVIEKQRDDPKLRKLMTELSSGDEIATSVFEYYMLFHGILFHRKHVESDDWQVCIPHQQIPTLVNCIHEHFGHVGPMHKFT
uniref:RNA-directed DNA polymerase n=1 Tax=Schizaphis graminum TaxID=13262 RepID=A0A2S2NNN8_SCHGA